MQHRDFTIGNYYLINNKIQQLTAKHILELHNMIKIHIEPIVLTDDIMLRLNFTVAKEKSAHGTNIFGISDYDIDYCFSWADFRKDYGFYVNYSDSPFREDDEKYYIVSVGVKYLHELQNLIYSLCKKELTLK